MAQKTPRSHAFPPTLCQRVARILLTAPPSYEAVALHWGQCDTLLRYGKLATSSLEKLTTYETLKGGLVTRSLPQVLLAVGGPTPKRPRVFGALLRRWRSCDS